jgi:hypothetical protein
MLVCNVSLRPPRRTIAAELAEAGLADDSSTTGSVVFATLVDDPASVGEIVDAYLGEIMLEAASAGDAANAGLSYAAEINEATTALSLEDGTAAATPSYTTWNPSDKSANMTLSNSDLTAVSGAASGGLGGVRAVTGRSSGKYYFEVTTTTITASYVGLAKSTNTLFGNSNNAVGVNASGSVFVNGTINGTVSLPGLGGGAIVGIAVDLTSNLIWFRVGASGSWNAVSGSANNPATATGGVSIAAIAGTLFPWFTTANTSENVTANFGATAFNGAVPSGFTSGW